MLKINNTGVKKVNVNGNRVHKVTVNGTVVFDDMYDLIWKVEYKHVDRLPYVHLDYVYVTVTTASRKDGVATKNVPVQVILHHDDDGSIYTETLNLNTPISQREVVNQDEREVDWIYQVDLKINGSLVHSGSVGQNQTYTGTHSFYES